MKKIVDQAISFVLAVVLVCGLLPTSIQAASAEDTAGTDETQQFDASSGSHPDEERTEDIETDQVPSAPIFLVDLEGTFRYVQGEAANGLHVEAASVDGGVISYQWYSSPEGDFSAAEPILNAVDAVMIPSTEQIGTTYYFVQASNTLDHENSVSTVSGMATVIVEEKSQQSIPDDHIETGIGPVADVEPPDTATDMVSELEAEGSTASVGADIMDIRQANLDYYMRNTLQAPFEALAVYSLTRDSEQTDAIPMNIPFDGGQYSYSNGEYGSSEAMTAIDAMVCGKNPREYYKMIDGAQVGIATDLIGEILSPENFKEDGTFAWTSGATSLALTKSYTNTYALLALEMYFGGQNWGISNGSVKQTRIGAIETYLESFVDADYDDLEIWGEDGDDWFNWKVEGGRVVSPIRDADAMTYLDVQTDAVLLLARWLNDGTEVTIHGKTEPLATVAHRELEGVLCTLDAFYQGKPDSGSFEADAGLLANATQKSIYLSHYISALVAAGRRNEIDESTLKEFFSYFVTQEFLENSQNITSFQLGAYYANERRPIVDLKHTWSGSMALGDYIHGEAILSTFKYTPPSIAEEDAIAIDLDMLDLPSTALSNLTLPTSGLYGSTITWNSSDAQAIDPETGAIAPPAAGEPTKTVTLTATATIGGYIGTKTFVIRLMSSAEANVKAAVNLDANALKIHLFTTSDLTLPAVGDNGSTITWTSSDPAVISNSGAVQCGGQERKVTLTATISKSSDTTSASETRSFEVTVGVLHGEDDVVAGIVNQIRESYQEDRNLTGSYWDVWMAKSILRDDFDQYNFSFYNLKTHKAGREWAGTDIGAAILQIVAQGDDPYDYQGVNYVQRLINYLNKPSSSSEYQYFWGTFTEPIFLVLGLEAAGAMAPEYEEGVKRCSQMMRSIGQGADYGGWAMVAVSNYVMDHPESRSTYEADFATLQKICRDALVQDAKSDQYGFIGGAPYVGYSAAVGSNSVLIGSVGAAKAGFAGWDFSSDEWTVGDMSLLERIYEHFFAGASGSDANFNTQPGIAFGDLYYGSNIWTSENPTQAKLAALLREAQTKLGNSKAYTAASLAALQAAYNSANAVADREYNFGQQYFALKDALKNLKEAGSTTVTVLGTTDRGTILDNASVNAAGSYLDILQAAAVEYGMSFTPTSTSITEFAGLAASGNGVWGLYDGEKRITDLYGKPEEGAGLTLKYCAGGSPKATLQEQLVYEAAQALDLGDTTSVSSNLSLPSSGLNGTSIIWASDKPASLKNTGEITQGRYDVRVNLTATINGSDGETSTTKAFTVIVKGDSTIAKQQYAYISVVDPKGKTYLARTKYEIEPGDTAYTLLKKTGLYLSVDEHSEYGVYVQAIEGWGEFSDGNQSGWMYRITHNGTTSFPGRSAALELVDDGDYVEWLFTRDLGKDLGSSVSETTSSEYVTLAPTVTADRYGSAEAAPTYYELLELISDAVDAKASSIVIAPKIRGSVSQVSVVIPTDAASELVHQTNADLVVETPVGDVTIPNKALSAIVSSARGTSIDVIITERGSSYAAGSLQSYSQTYTSEQINSAVAIQVSIGSGGRYITSFNGRSISLDLPLSSTDFKLGAWYDVLHVSDSSYGTEKLNGKCMREGGQLYIPITVSHLSTFIVIPDQTSNTANQYLPFLDVRTADWFYNEVSYVYNRGLFNGDSPTMFLPNGNMDRAMLVTVLHRLEGTPSTTNYTGFADVAAGQWYSNGVAWANSTGVVNGKGGGKFAPFDSVTREEIAVILYRYAKIKGRDVGASADLYAFTDGAKTSDWAMRAMQWANAKGIINGKGSGILDPGGYATRAEVAAMLMRFIESY